MKRLKTTIVCLALGVVTFAAGACELVFGDPAAGLDRRDIPYNRTLCHPNPNGACS
jgi:hypothetical protein